MPSVNLDGITLLKTFEGCELHSYQDAVGVTTIGFGHTPASPGQTITQAQADALLQSDLAAFERGVNASVQRNLTSNQFSALVCFAYNVGMEAFKDSTLLRCVNSGDIEGAAEQFGKWIYGDGKILPGLVTRRAAERALFLK